MLSGFTGEQVRFEYGRGPAEDAVTDDGSGNMMLFDRDAVRDVQAVVEPFLAAPIEN